MMCNSPPTGSGVSIKLETEQKWVHPPGEAADVKARHLAQDSFPKVF